MAVPNQEQQRVLQGCIWGGNRIYSLDMCSQTPEQQSAVLISTGPLTLLSPQHFIYSNTSYFGVIQTDHMTNTVLLVSLVWENLHVKYLQCPAESRLAWRVWRGNCCCCGLKGRSVISKPTVSVPSYFH